MENQTREGAAVCRQTGGPGQSPAAETRRTQSRRATGKEADQRDRDPHRTPAAATSRVSRAAALLLVPLPSLPTQGRRRGDPETDTCSSSEGSIASSSFLPTPSSLRLSGRRVRTALHPPPQRRPLSPRLPTSLSLSLALSPLSSSSAHRRGKEGRGRKKKGASFLPSAGGRPGDYGSAGLRAPDAAEVSCLDPWPPAHVETLLVLVPPCFLAGLAASSSS